MCSQSAYAYGRTTIVPRTGPLSASSAWPRSSWYHRGKFSACAVSTAAESSLGPTALRRASEVGLGRLIYDSRDLARHVGECDAGARQQQRAAEQERHAIPVSERVS